MAGKRISNKQQQEDATRRQEWEMVEVRSRENMRQLYRLNNQAAAREMPYMIPRIPMTIPDLDNQSISRSSRISAQLLPCRLHRTFDATLSPIRLPHKSTISAIPGRDKVPSGRGLVSAYADLLLSAFVGTKID